MVGLVVELLGVVKTSQLSGQIIASLEGQTGQARVEIAKANERVANAEKRTAELLAEIQPRSLTVIQQRNVGNALRHFSGRKVLVSSFRGDLEAYQVGKQIVASLKYAGLDILENLGNAGGLPSTGVLIACSRSNREIASVLSAALQSTGALGNVPIFESHGTIGGGAELGAFKGSRDPLEIPQFEVLVASKPLPILK
jgi:hypothetical protein